MKSPVATPEERVRETEKNVWEEIWLKDEQVIAVRPRLELEPFFRFSFEEWRKKFESADSIPFALVTFAQKICPTEG